MLAAQFDFAATKGDGRVMFNVKEVGAAEMRVAVRFARPQAASVDLDRDRGVLRACRIESEPAMDVLEVPADVCDHHVARREFRGCMPGFEEPLCQVSPNSSSMILAHDSA